LVSITTLVGDFSDNLPFMWVIILKNFN